MTLEDSWSGTSWINVVSLLHIPIVVSKVIRLWHALVILSYTHLHVFATCLITVMRTYQQCSILRLFTKKLEQCFKVFLHFIFYISVSPRESAFVSKRDLMIL